MKKSLSEKGNAMLVEWQRTSGKDATMEALLKALKKIGMSHLMEKVAGIHFYYHAEKKKKQTHEIGIKLNQTLYITPKEIEGTHNQSHACKHSQKSSLECFFFLSKKSLF